MSRYFIIANIYAWALLLSQASFAHIKTISPKNDEIILVKTSLAIATMIQFPDSTSVQLPIIGDQSAFRIETIDKGITIKPLRYGAKTNLYLFTDKKRYNFRLITEGQDQADYILYIKSSENTDSLTWKVIEKSVSSKELKLTLHKVAATKDNKILLDLSLIALNLDTKVSPENIWIYQDKDSKLISSLFLSDKTTTVRKPIQIGIALSKNDLKEGKSLQLTLKMKEFNLSIDIPREVLWK
ncbi:MAG: TrbG/VirB9 family P-type conjugative transfer protein [Bdellovibrionaceae bacterium]|nr:TrbG/VirB9 family P-type conjugative transfer protein [Pseudobdellovibrionaceae bacterium]